MLRAGWLLVLSLSALGTVPAAVRALQAPDGTVAFEAAPRLRQARALHDEPGAPLVDYYFTLRLPENAGEPLQRVRIRQREGLEPLRFRDEAVAFAGVPNNRGRAFPLQAVEREGSAVSLVLDEPAPPGTTLTVGIRSRQNPTSGGIYLFGVTAYPAGERAQGLYLGIGRLQFDRPDGLLF